VADQSVDTVDPQRLRKNPENPRLIFRADDLRALEESIDTQGILVPLTVYRDGRALVILDGERRWRCAVKLGLSTVPVIIQPKPDRLQNIMMMFAIHNARKDWDPLPTAYKLQELEGEFNKRQGRPPRESELAELASIQRGEVRRLKKLLALPERYRNELMAELEKPRSEQVITVDHVLETTRGADALRRRGIITAAEEDPLRQAVLDKFRSKVIGNTVAPRQLARLARAVEREEVPKAVARRAATRLISDDRYSIDQAFEDTAAQADFEHGVEQAVDRLHGKLEEVAAGKTKVGEGLRAQLLALVETIERVLGI
jgi:ParB family chromosome partitioning protein